MGSGGEGAPAPGGADDEEGRAYGRRNRDRREARRPKLEEGEAGDAARRCGPVEQKDETRSGRAEAARRSCREGSEVERGRGSCAGRDGGRTRWRNKTAAGGASCKMARGCRWEP
jgi:hypothetical protein